MSFINQLHSTFGSILTEIMVSLNPGFFLMNKHKPTEFSYFCFVCVIAVFQKGSSFEIICKFPVN